MAVYCMIVNHCASSNSQYILCTYIQVHDLAGLLNNYKKMSRFFNETDQTTLLPVKATQLINTDKADVAEKVALSAQGRRTTAKKRALSTLTDVEELIGALVSTEANDGYVPLLPHTGVSLYYRVGTSATHLSMLTESAVLGTVSSAATPETWRRFIGQQLVLLTELMTFIVPAFFADNATMISPLGKRKARGTVRSDLTLHSKLFVPTKAKVDTGKVRSMALQYAREARVCDVHCSSVSKDLLTHIAGLTLPASHDEKTVLMLKDSKLTPTGSLLSSCSDSIMQVQCAAKLGRLSSICSLLVTMTSSEMELYRVHSSSASDIDTPSVSIAQLHGAVQLTAAAAPPAVADFVKAALERGDTLLPYYGLPRLARCMFKPNEEVAASTLNCVNARFRALLNGFRVLHFPSTEPLYQVLDALHKPYQVRLLAEVAGFCR
jgi:hypothetical protein